MEIKKNDQITLEITGITSEGYGIGRYCGFAVIVPQSAIGDKLEAVIIKIAKNYAVGKIVSIIYPSHDREEIVDCPVFSLCGGCEFRHIKYEAELKYKEQRVKDAISRIGGFSQDIVKPIIPCEHVLRYRNKAQIPVGKGKDGKIVMGFYANHSHRIIDCCDCLLQPEIFSDIESVFKKWCIESGNTIYDEFSKKGSIRHLYIRYGEASGEIMVCIVSSGKLKKTDDLINRLHSSIPQISSIIVNLNSDDTNVIMGKKNDILFGNEFIRDDICSLHLSIKPLSFYQVNRQEAQILYEKVREYADLHGNEVLLDLYCGTGTIGLTMAPYIKKLYGAEIVEDAINDARENAKRNNLLNAEFVCMDASEAANFFSKKDIKPNIITVDPPRKGCSAELICTIEKMQPDRIIYVSCDPATLARDLKIFSEKGFDVKEITPVDMFPRTSNVEAAALIIRK